MSETQGPAALQDAEELRRLYYDEELTQAEIADRLDVTRKDVGHAMDRLGIAPGQGGSPAPIRSLLDTDPADIGGDYEPLEPDPRPDMAPLADLADAHAEDPHRARALLASVDEHRAAVYDALREGGRQGMGELRARYAQRVDSPRSRTWLRRCLNDLADLGVVERHGQTSTRTYRLTDGDRDGD